jgi:hypothetical protein
MYKKDRFACSILGACVSSGYLNFSLFPGRINRVSEASQTVDGASTEFPTFNN